MTCKHEFQCSVGVAMFDDKPGQEAEREAMTLLAQEAFDEGFDIARSNEPGLHLFTNSKAFATIRARSTREAKER